VGVGVGHEYRLEDGETIGYHGRTAGGASPSGIRTLRRHRARRGDPVGSHRLRSDTREPIDGDGSSEFPYRLLWRVDPTTGTFDRPRGLAHHGGSARHDGTHVRPRFGPNGAECCSRPIAPRAPTSTSPTCRPSPSTPRSNESGGEPEAPSRAARDRCVRAPRSPVSSGTGAYRAGGVREARDGRAVLPTSRRGPGRADRSRPRSPGSARFGGIERVAVPAPASVVAGAGVDVDPDAVAVGVAK
jgi:hypothetical protein